MESNLLIANYDVRLLYLKHEKTFTTEDTEEHGGNNFQILISSVLLCVLCGETITKNHKATS